MAADEDPSGEPQRLPPYVKRPPGRRDPPGVRFSYPVHAKNRSVVTDWDILCTSHGGNARRCYDHLAQTPTARPSNPDRGQRFRGRLGRRGLIQYEVGGGARVWYHVDDARHIVVIDEVHVGHTKQTE